MCQSCVPPVNEQAANQFAERMLGLLNSSGLMLMISIGHRTGLFDTMAGQPRATSGEIAKRAGLQERYVREWLGAMVTGRIVNYDRETRTYVLPAEHAAFLTRAATPNNIAATAQWVAVLGQVEGEVVDCFHNGGGVHYSAYSRFHDVMAEESSQTVVAALHEHILPIIPERLEKLQRGLQVLDVGCGSGRAMLSLAESFPRSTFTGYDFSEEAIGKGRAAAAERGLTNVRFEVKDAARIGESRKYDLITAFDAIHDQREPARVLSEIRTALKDDGLFLMQDIRSSSELQNNMDHPVAPFLYTISTMHCMTVSLALGGAGLGTCWGEELALRMLNDAGFGRVSVQQLPHDIMNSYFIAQP
jgi:2-polyprenyl-3-methyl-5-hydroxy-6-metoxy-1,4-benzoquinol methylase